MPLWWFLNRASNKHLHIDFLSIHSKLCWWLAMIFFFVVYSFLTVNFNWVFKSFILHKNIRNFVLGTKGCKKSKWSKKEKILTKQTRKANHFIIIQLQHFWNYKLNGFRVQCNHNKSYTSLIKISYHICPLLSSATNVIAVIFQGTFNIVQL